MFIETENLVFTSVEASKQKMLIRKRICFTKQDMIGS